MNKIEKQEEKEIRRRKKEKLGGETEPKRVVERK